VVKRCENDVKFGAVYELNSKRFGDDSSCVPGEKRFVVVKLENIKTLPSSGLYMLIWSLSGYSGN